MPPDISSFMNTVNPTTIGPILEEAKAALKEIAEKHGLDFKPAKSLYNARGFTIRGEFALREIGGLARDQAEFNQFCRSYGLMPEDYGAEITVNREAVKLVGLALKRPKYPLILENLSTGKRLCYTTDLLPKILAVRRPATPPSA
jgi:hypothetical protein